MPKARYDGIAEWYDTEVIAGFAPVFADLVASKVTELTASGEVVVDVGCGTGILLQALRAHGLHPVGVDLSADQLQIASGRAGPLLRADVAQLPLRSASVRVAVAGFVHTDLDDFGAAVRQIARVLRSGGRLVYVGTHPCFIGPFVKRTPERDQQELVVRPGYGDPALVFTGSGASPGLKARVGSHNLSLARFLRAFLDAGLVLESLDELDTEARPWVVHPDDGTVVPWNVLVVSRKP